jgi:hypothetical protein
MGLESSEGELVPQCPIELIGDGRVKNSLKIRPVCFRDYLNYGRQLGGIW